MSLQQIIIIIAIAALVLTFIVGFVLKKQKNLFISYLQNFAGALFIFSGWVKAIDPLGTAYKMEQYFAEFQGLFESTWFSFISPLFPLLSTYSSGFSVFMIVLEIVLGVMLIIGSRPKLTSWLFLLIVLFFTFLTGFTYLTGYVPDELIVFETPEGAEKLVPSIETTDAASRGWTQKEDAESIKVTFFDFKYWGEFKESNQKVTDCGCFGDFIKLKPKTSFFKDIFLLIPALIFVFFSRKMHQLFNVPVRAGIVGVAAVGLFIYCLSNYVWDLPHTDFRPFKEGVDIVEQKRVEDEAAANVEIIGWQMINDKTKEVVDVMNPKYTEVIKEYPKDGGWRVNDQIKTEPLIKRTKISEFEVQGYEGYNMTDSILQKKGYHYLIIAEKLKQEGSTKEMVTVKDTIYQLDTVFMEETADTQIVKSIAEIKSREEEVIKPVWNKKYISRYREVLNPFLRVAREAGIEAQAVTKLNSTSVVEDFKATTNSDYTFYLADDILLKTIIRSNPGIILMKDGKIIKKWHWKKLPEFSEVRNDFIE